ncbi:MAG TPA: hypothetical protein VHE32_11635 [Rhodanobacteraceae bacterium]|jgi:hypothetical protein|nr:hypothetical protein [Rhodanobacteraceae bacterium]
MKIPVNVIGTILNSEKIAHRVKVVNDVGDTGGFYIFEWWDESDGPNEHRAFDSWVESQNDLRQFFAQSGWQIDWSA